MKSILFALIIMMTINAYSQQTPENIGREFVNGLSLQKDFETMDIFFNEKDFYQLFEDFRKNPKIKDEQKKYFSDPVQIETARKEFWEDRIKNQKKWEQALKLLKAENSSVIYKNVKVDIKGEDGFQIYKIKIIFNIKNGGTLTEKFAKVEAAVVGGLMKIAIVKSFNLQQEQSD